MISFLIYLLKANILLLLALGCYQLFLKSLSFHQWKRIFLLLGLVFSIVAPIYTWTTYNIVHLPKQKISPTLNIGTESVITAPTSNLTVWLILISSIYFLGLFIASGRLIFNYYQFYKFNQQAILLNKSLNIYHHPKIDIAYSTLRKIYINKNIFQESDLHIIILHEQEHINQKHAIDLHFCNVIKCFFWFNPLINYYQKSISLNHECIVDSYIAKVEDAALYQMQLVKYQCVSPQIDLANQFAISNLKQRILFMNQKKSSVWKLSLFATSVFALVSVGIAMAHQKENVYTQQEKTIIPNTTSNILEQSNNIDQQNQDSSKIVTVGNEIMVVGSHKSDTIVVGRIDNENTLNFGGGFQKVDTYRIIKYDTLKKYESGDWSKITADTIYLYHPDTDVSETHIIYGQQERNYGKYDLNDFSKNNTTIWIGGRKANIDLDKVDPNHIESISVKTTENGKKQSTEIVLKKEFESHYK